MKFKRSWLSLFIIFVLIQFLYSIKTEAKINRYKLVNRHNPVKQKTDAKSPFTFGNGGFAFTADVTGLQTFQKYYYNNGIPLEILSDWCWHSFPNPNNYKLKDAYRYYNVHGRKIAYPTKQNTKAGQWLRINPQRLPLGQVGFELKKSDGSLITIKNIKHVYQKLDLWKGIITSQFEVEGNKDSLVTICHPQKDFIFVKVKSSLISKGLLSIAFNFPNAFNPSIKNYPSYIWKKPNAHLTEIILNKNNSAVLERIVDKTDYYVYLNWSNHLIFKQKAKHYFRLIPSAKEKQFEFTFGFSKKDTIKPIPKYDQTLKASILYWKYFWLTGGAEGLSGNTDRRANELERRIILSQYLTATQFAGSFPPQESGLTLSSCISINVLSS